jgi:hypothetical protein
MANAIICLNLIAVIAVTIPLILLITTPIARFIAIWKRQEIKSTAGIASVLMIPAIIAGVAGITRILGIYNKLVFRYDSRFSPNGY